MFDFGVSAVRTPDECWASVGRIASTVSVCVQDPPPPLWAAEETFRAAAGRSGSCRDCLLLLSLRCMRHVVSSSALLTNLRAHTHYRTCRQIESI
eukprot:scaffold851_cov122-Isochrysis_galbana.AAC.1